MKTGEAGPDEWCCCAAVDGDALSSYRNLCFVRYLVVACASPPRIKRLPLGPGRDEGQDGNCGGVCGVNRDCWYLYGVQLFYSANNFTTATNNMTGGHEGDSEVRSPE